MSAIRMHANAYAPPPAELTIRSATRADARPISQLLAAAYTPPSGGRATDHYPFPQFLSSQRLADLLAQGGMCWLLAEKHHQPVGAFGCYLNIGASNDRVAECFGLVVRGDCRRAGVGSKLVAAMTRFLVSRGARVILAETRTADPAAAMAFRKAGYSPLGFEPFAHATPAGAESMLMLGKLCQMPAAVHALTASGCPTANRLAQLVRRHLAARLPSQGALPDASPARIASASVSAGDERASTRRNPPGGHFESYTENPSRTNNLPRLGLAARHSAGVVEFDRLEGEDPAAKRFARMCCLHSEDGRMRASVTGIFDRSDRRLRIARMQCEPEIERDVVLATAIERFERMLCAERMTLTVDVRTDAAQLLATLEGLGFFATAYFPEMIVANGLGIDVVQFTKVNGLPVQRSLRDVRQLDWKRAQTVCSTVCGSREVSD